MCWRQALKAHLHLATASKHHECSHEVTDNPVCSWLTQCTKTPTFPPRPAEYLSSPALRGSQAQVTCRVELKSWNTRPAQWEAVVSQLLRLEPIFSPSAALPAARPDDPGLTSTTTIDESALDGLPRINHSRRSVACCTPAIIPE